MSTRVETTGRVTAGKLYMRRREAFQLAISRLRDCEVDISVERKHATRSLPANSYYWKVIVGTFSDYTGYTRKEMHDYFKRHFLPPSHAPLELCIKDTKGLVVDTFKECNLTTTDLNKPKFYDYCEAIRLWSNETVGVYIETPDEASREIAADYEARFEGLLEEGMHVIEDPARLLTEGEARS